MCVWVCVDGLCVQITEDFIAAYQANYGFNEDGASTATEEPQPEKEKEEEEEEEEKPQEEKVTDSSAIKEEKKKGEKRKAEAGGSLPQQWDRFL